LKGLPDEEPCLALARTFLSIQDRLWPELANTDAVPKPSAEEARKMAKEFKARFLGEHAELEGHSFPCGKTRNTMEIDEEAAVWIRQLFHLYTEEKWSPLKIGRYFNEKIVVTIE
jgi:hypothetical protein